MGGYINSILGSKVPDHDIGIPEAPGLGLPNALAQILRECSFIGIGIDNFNQPGDHLLFGAPHDPAAKPAPLKLPIHPHLDPSVLIDPDHILLDLEIAHPIIKLREPSKRLMVQVKHIGVRDVLDYAQAEWDALEKQ